MHIDLLSKSVQSALKVCIAPCVPSLGLSTGCWMDQGQNPLLPGVEWLNCHKNFKLKHLSDLRYHWREELLNSAILGAMKSDRRGTKLKIRFRNNLRAKLGW